jgi:hypothetical protein
MPYPKNKKKQLKVIKKVTQSTTRRIYGDIDYKSDA